MAADHGGCFLIYRLGDGNVKVLIIIIIMVVYMVLGALVFSYLESSNELTMVEDYNRARLKFLEKNSDADSTELDALLHLHRNVAVLSAKNISCWDFRGSLYFVFTLVTTIGYGMVVPQTDGGKVFCVFYGVLGCSIFILFYNLCLERIILIWTYILRHILLLSKKLQRKVQIASNIGSEFTDIEKEEETGKPSLINLLIGLFLQTTLVWMFTAAMYKWFEGWEFLDSVYFCFISFALVGFGDFVAHMNYDVKHQNSILYTIMNGILLVLGIICMYSLLNVISIGMKQLIQKAMECLTRNCDTCYYNPKLKRNVRNRKRRGGTALVSTISSAAPYMSKRSRGMINTSLGQSEVDIPSDYDEMSAEFQEFSGEERKNQLNILKEILSEQAHSRSRLSVSSDATSVNEPNHAKKLPEPDCNYGALSGYGDKQFLEIPRILVGNSESEDNTRPETASSIIIPVRPKTRSKNTKSAYARKIGSLNIAADTLAKSAGDANNDSSDESDEDL